jgi:hypothetical protein
MADLDTMGKSVQKLFLKSPEYSVLESMGEARYAQSLHTGPRCTLPAWQPRLQELLALWP